MPEISEEEFREYIDLKRREAERQKRIEAMLGKGTSQLNQFRRDLNTLRGHASVFSNVLQGECQRRGNPQEFVLDTWRRVQNYLPAELLCIIKGKVNIKHSFRRHLKDFGWSFKINYRNGTFIVKKRI